MFHSHLFSTLSVVERTTYCLMVFVYEGAGKRQADDAEMTEKLCKKHACRIQRCLSRSNYQEKRCSLELEAYRKCCKRVLEHAKATANPSVISRPAYTSYTPLLPHNRFHSDIDGRRH